MKLPSPRMSIMDSWTSLPTAFTSGTMGIMGRLITGRLQRARLSVPWSHGATMSGAAVKRREIPWHCFTNRFPKLHSENLLVSCVLHLILIL